MNGKLSADNAVVGEVSAGQWSDGREKEKPMEELTMGELLFRVLVGDHLNEHLVVSH